MTWIIFSVVVVNTMLLMVLAISLIDWRKVKLGFSRTYYQIYVGGETQPELYRTHEDAIEALYAWLNKHHFDNWTCQNGDQYVTVGTGWGGDVLGGIWRVKVPIWKLKTIATKQLGEVAK